MISNQSESGIKDQLSFKTLITGILLFLLLISGEVAQGSGSAGIAFHGADYVEDTIPDHVATGKSGQYSITFVNSGMVSWENNVEVFGIFCEGIRDGIRVDPLFSRVPNGIEIQPGKSYQFLFSISLDKPDQFSLTFTPSRMVMNKPSPIGESVKIIIDTNMSVITKTDYSKSGSIQVLAEQATFNVLLDDKVIGVTPVQSVGILPGKHRVRVVGDNFEKSYDVIVKPDEVSTIAIDPVSGTHSLSSKMKSDSSQDILTNLVLTNFILVTGIFIGFTVTGGYALLVVLRRIKKARYTIEHISTGFSSQQPSNPQTIRIESKRPGDTKKKVTFDPLMMVCQENEECDLQVKVMNSGNRFIQVGNEKVSGGDARILSVRIFAEEPGDNQKIEEIRFSDSAGKEFIEQVVFRYRVRPALIPIDWSFSHFIFGKKTIIAVIKVKNLSPNAINAAEMIIPPEEEGEIQVMVEFPENNDPEVSHVVEISSGLSPPVKLRLRIPLNYGVILGARKKFNAALTYYDKLFETDPGSADLWVQRGTILENLGRHSDAEKSYRHALEIEPSNQNAQKAAEEFLKKKSGIETNIQREKTPGFPSSLLNLYTPSTIIGADRTGKLYLAERISDNKKVMVKVIDSSKMQVNSLHLSIQAWRSLRHPHILRLSGWEIDPVPFIETEFVEGAVQSGVKKRVLADLMVPIPHRAAVKISIGIASGLAFMHQQGVRHYLLEPTTIFLDRNLHVRVGGIDASMTLSGQEIDRTSWVLAPEQVASDKFGNPGKKTDIYQVGALLYNLLTGLRPYGQEKNPGQMSAAIWDDPDESLVLPSSCKSELGIFDNIIIQCLAVDKNKRYGSITELIVELKSIQKTMDEQQADKMRKS